ncbi:MAG: hypothetical protein ACTH9H_11890 [Galactobacter sp.]
MRHPYGETITVHPYIEDGGRDDLGNQISGWGEDYEREYVAVAPHVEAEQIGEMRTMIVTGLDLYDTFDCPITPYDEITVRGERYRVDGDVAHWRNPFNWDEPGAVITAKKVDG